MAFAYYIVAITAVALFVSANDFPVDDICGKTANPALCRQVLGGARSQNLNLRDLASVGFDVVAVGAGLSQTKFRALLQSSPRLDLYPQFTQCLNLYEDVSGKINAAKEAAGQGRWAQVVANASPVLSDVDQCEDLFINTSPVHGEYSTRVRIAAEAIIDIAKSL